MPGTLPAANALAPNDRSLRLTGARPLRVSANTARYFFPIPSHMHQELELGVILAGSMRRVTGGVETCFGPGDVWLCNSCEPHSAHFTQVPCSRVTAMACPSLLATVRFPEAPEFPWSTPFLVPPRERPVVSDANRDEVLACATRLTQAATDGSEAGQLRMRLAFLDVLLVLTRDWRRDARPHAVSDGYDRIGPALELARGERRMVRCEEAAAACGLSVNGLNQQFRKLMGATFADYALRYRFGGAARDLVETNDPIKAIARRWGFTDTSHLHRVFRRFAKCTPAEYRKRPPFPA